MWVLDVLNASRSSVDTTFYLIAGEWSLGRKKCHFNFQADASISRTHALIRVGALSLEQLRDPQARPELVLEDQNSRFGSFVNQTQCFRECALKNGDLVTFGAKRTVLRVRYQAFVLVASRIQRAHRSHVNETCQRLGMHLISTESGDATHCVMDAGRIIATVKVLWSLVHAQPVVTTAWLDAILERKSLAEPLPRYDQFLPMGDNMPSVSSSYLPNPTRKTLFQRHVVVFLTPQSMEKLIEAMDGIVIAAYKDHTNDDAMLREIEQYSATRHVLIVEPVPSSGFSSAISSSDARESHASSHADVERRIELFRSIGATFTAIQELAASVIFAKAPTPSSQCSFSSSLAGHQSMSAQIMSFPEHLSLQPPSRDDDDGDDHQEGQEDKGPDKHEANGVGGGPSTYPTNGNSIEITPQSREPTMTRESADHPVSDDIVDESIQVKEEPTPVNMATIRTANADAHITEEGAFNVMSLPDFNALPIEPVAADQEASVARHPMEAPPPIEDQVGDSGSAQTSSDGWLSARAMVQRDVKNIIPSQDDAELFPAENVQPPIVTCNLVVKRLPSAHSLSSQGAERSTNGVPNFKRFKKGNGYASRSSASLFPQATVISVVIENDDCAVIQQNFEEQEEQERIADELFAMVEKRTRRKQL